MDPGDLIFKKHPGLDPSLLYSKLQVHHDWMGFDYSLEIIPTNECVGILISRIKNPQENIFVAIRSFYFILTPSEIGWTTNLTWAETKDIINE
jgi:hypothetical protein